MAIYIRGGIAFVPLTERHLNPADDSTEICGVQILGDTPLTIINMYRPPLRHTDDDDREDHFDPTALPSGEDVLVLGDLNGHHPLWDHGCGEADAVGERMAEWLDSVDWTALNTGEATHASYRSGSETAPDIAACSRSMARRADWTVGPDLGSDHLPMVVKVRTSPTGTTRIRKPKWAFHKADWAAFRDDCEAALAGEDPERASAQLLVTKFTEAVLRASAKHVPRGARANPKPWALDPELRRAAEERREARRHLDPNVPSTRESWIAAKRRAADVEKRVSQHHFRQFVEGTLNRPASLGRVTKILKAWESSGDDHRPGQALKEDGRILASDREKAEAFNRTYAHVSRQVRAAKLDREAKKRTSEFRRRGCQACAGQRDAGCCTEFTMEELVSHIQRLQLKKAPGPDGVANEHLRHLGPVARRALLRAINASWRDGAVPQEWRRATIIPIPKTGKDKERVASYRPIALTSHLSKLVERLILARLTHVAEQHHMIPAEQVGFRAGRSVEDNIGRLVQQVQDGWNRPKSRKRSAPDGTCAQKYVLLAFDFARAYDTVDHGLLRTRFLELGVPLCLTQWVWAFLRDRRARVEIDGTLSGERVYRAGLPQGSVLSPALFVLWSAPLVTALQKVPGTTACMYADDTAALCAGNDIETARRRAQQAADTLTKWAREAKMTVAGQKTQALVLSQWSRDAADCTVKVAGEAVVAGDQLRLLGITLDRLLHFGPHCRALRRRVRPRTAQLRKLTGREWGLEERQLRTVANGYVRGALEHAAAAWLPATSPAHQLLLDREMRAAARVVTGCPISTPAHAVLAEAGLAPVAERSTALAARLLAKARALPEDDPLRKVAEADPPARLASVTGWRGVGRGALEAAGVTPPFESLFPHREPPWTRPPKVTFNLTAGTPLTATASDQKRREAATLHLAALPQCATWIWTDGSADAGVKNGGAGALIVRPDGETHELRRPAGRICSSFRAEMIALQAALRFLIENPAHTEDPVVCCTDSQSALAALREGPSAQKSQLGTDIWGALRQLAVGGRTIILQWVPAHCGIPGNEKVDAIAKDAAATLAQDDVPVDVRTAYRAVARLARDRTTQAWPAGWYRSLMGPRVPPPVPAGDRSSAVDIHQLRAGHWSGSAQWRHRVGLNPSRQCEQCPSRRCDAARCVVCREEADTPQHVLIRCPALIRTRHRLLGTISPGMEDVRGAEVVAALAAAYRTLQSRSATPA